MEIDFRNGMHILAEDECWQLLTDNEVARLAVAPGGRPDIFPVNYIAINGNLVFRTAEGSKLTSVVINQAVAFEIDGYQPETNEAWSVVVSGTAHTVQSDDLAAEMESLPLFPWNTSPKHHFIEIVPRRVDGRRFVAVGRTKP
jgi:uncharacterized protein